MAHEGLWEQLDKLDRWGTAQRAKCQYLINPERYVVTLLNTEYVVNLSQREIFSLRPSLPPAPAEFLEQLCILAYLINARDLPLANKIVKGEALPGGQFFFRGQHSLPTQKLEVAFGDCPQALYRISVQSFDKLSPQDPFRETVSNVEPFNAKRREFGDASIEVDVLPRLPLTIVIWRRDDEFPARASILFDQTAAANLPLDALSAAVNLTVEALIKAVKAGR
jgi:hypothetical protein